MTHTYRPDIQQQLKESLELLKTLLGPDLLGVYLYGSALVGGLQKYSDLDLAVVIGRATTLEEKAKLIARLLQISGLYMKGSKLPIEMTLVEKAKINPWQYPPHVDFQYGEWLRQAFESGVIQPWQTSEMPDLAILITQVLLKSETLWGLDAKLLLAPVPYADFMKAMLQDINRLNTNLEHDTRNVLLALARIWSTLETDTIRSKPAAADHAIDGLPAMYQPVMQRAKAICVGEEHEHWEDVQKLIKPCTDFMIERIETLIPLIQCDDLKKKIRLHERCKGEEK